MKKLTVGILAVALILGLGTATVFAAGHYHTNHGMVQTVQTDALSGNQRYCRDANDDGVCDYYGSHRCAGGYGQWCGHGHGSHSCWRR